MNKFRRWLIKKEFEIGLLSIPWGSGTAYIDDYIEDIENGNK